MPPGIEQQQCAGEKDSYCHPALKEPTFYAEIRLTASIHLISNVTQPTAADPDSVRPKRNMP